MKVHTSASTAVRRVVNPFSTAVTMLVQGGHRPPRRGHAVRVCGDWNPPWPPDDDGGAGVREPRRPRPTMPSAATALAIARPNDGETWGRQDDRKPPRQR